LWRQRLAEFRERYAASPLKIFHCPVSKFGTGSVVGFHPVFQFANVVEEQPRAMFAPTDA
jgi:hypothetical protein